VLNGYQLAISERLDLIVLVMVADGPIVVSAIGYGSPLRSATIGSLANTLPPVVQGERTLAATHSAHAKES